MKTTRLKPLILANRWLARLFYLSFPILLLLLAEKDSAALLPTLLTCGLGFAVVSLFRHIFNAPRPYEVSGVAPLIPQKGHGHSFPSRHTFSAFIIATAFFHFNPICGIILFCAGFMLAFLRVALGVHYIKDVVAGALLGILGGIVGLWMLP